MTPPTLSHNSTTDPHSSTLPTAQQVVADLPWRWSVQGKIFLIGGLGFMFDAWDVTLNGVLVPLLRSDWDLAPGQVALIGTANLLGMALGAVAWGGVADRLGRRRAFTYTLLLFSLFTVAGALAPNLTVFLLLRFIAGVGLGGCIPVDYALVGEFSPRAVRGRVLTAMDMWWPIGAFLCGVTSALLLGWLGSWRWTMVVLILPALLVAWARRSVPESPLYLAATGREPAARRIIDDLVARTGATPVDYRIVPDAATQAPMWRQLGELWTRHGRITIAAWSLFVAIMTFYYGVILWLPSILIAAGESSSAAVLRTSWMYLVGIAGVALAAALVERLGRRWLLTLSSLSAAATMVLFALLLGPVLLADAGSAPSPSGSASASPTAAASSPAVVAALLAFGFLIQVAIPVLYAYVSELYPTPLRASGFGWASAASRVTSGFVPVIFGSWLWPTFGLTWTFVIMGAVVLVSLLLMWLWAPETRTTTARSS